MVLAQGDVQGTFKVRDVPSGRGKITRFTDGEKGRAQFSARGEKEMEHPESFRENKDF